MSALSGRRRLVVAGLAAGLAIGAAIGATTLIGASSEGFEGPRPVVLHVARVLADPGVDLDLTAGTFCPAPNAESCHVVSATVHVLSRGSPGWISLPGRAEDSTFAFEVPGGLVGDAGFSYWLEMRTEDGAVVELPEGGPEAPFRVLTTAGLETSEWPERFSWSDIRRPEGVVARLRYGDGAREVGRTGGHGEERPSGPSSFDVALDGSILVADWVHGRVLVLTGTGSFTRTIPLPVRRPVDLAAGRSGFAVTTLGLDATVFELGPTGEQIGRYEVAPGVTERVALTPDGPRVWVGPAQWAPVRSAPGIPLAAAEQARALAPAIPGRDGAVALSSELPGGRIAFVWERPDGSRAGTVLRLPTGVEPGVDYFVVGLPDGGAVAARGLWAEGHEAVALLRFSAEGAVASATLLPPPSHEQEAAQSTVRFRAPDEVLEVVAEPSGIRIDRFEVT